VNALRHGKPAGKNSERVRGNGMFTPPLSGDDRKIRALRERERHNEKTYGWRP
jgi:hypothetical protein